MCPLSVVYLRSSVLSYLYRGAENDGHENDGPSKLQGMKLQDMTRIDSILFNFSFASSVVMLTLQQWNCVM